MLFSQFQHGNGGYRPVPRTPRHNLPATPQLSNLTILCTKRSHLQVTMDYVGERSTSQGNGFSEYRCRLCGCRKGFVRDRVDGKVKQLFAVAR